MIEIKTSGAMRFAYCTLRGLKPQGGHFVPTLLCWNMHHVLGFKKLSNKGPVFFISIQIIYVPENYLAPISWPMNRFHYFNRQNKILRRLHITASISITSVKAYCDDKLTIKIFDKEEWGASSPSAFNLNSS